MTPGRLDAISTRWSLIRMARADDRDAQTARSALVLRYAKAVRAYVGGILKDRTDADELAQDVIVRLLQGDFAGADPTRGRFRDLLKTAVRNMVRHHWEKQSRRRPSHAELDLIARDEPSADPWLASWQKTVLDHTWSALKDDDKNDRKASAYAVLRLRSELPDASSDELAIELSRRTGKEVLPANFRQLLRRARLRFAELLIDEVSSCLEDVNPDRVLDELSALELLEHVRDFLPSDWSSTGQLSQ